MRPRRHPQHPAAGFSVLLSALMLAMFFLLLLMVFQQRRAVEERLVKQTLQARLDREVKKELSRLSRPGLGAPKTGLPHGAARVRQAIDNVLERSFNQMLALEERRATLRRMLRQTQNVTRRRQIHGQLRQVDKELEIARVWVLMLEDRRLAARRLEESESKDVEKPSPEAPGTSPSGGSVPRLPDWLSALQTWG